MFRVIIAGGRDFDDYELLKSTMDRLLVNIKRQICIISGAARGADLLGERYAKEKGYTVRRFPADWSLGRGAGFIRNVETMVYYLKEIFKITDDDIQKALSVKLNRLASKIYGKEAAHDTET